MPDEGRGGGDQTRVGVGFVFGILDATAVPGPVVVQLLSALGLAEAAVRQQLARMLRQGHLERERLGRVSVYRMTGGYLERWLRLRHGDRPPNWAGAYEAVVYDIPESRRRRRELLQSAAARAGYAPVRPGLLIGLEPPEFAAPFGPGGELAASVDLVEVGQLQLDLPAARRLAARAWQLDQRAVELGAAAGELAALLRSEPFGRPTGEEALGRLWAGLAAAGTVRFAVPALPAVLLPSPWPGDQVQQHFAELVERLRPPVGEYLYAMLSASPYASLVRGGWWPEVRDAVTADPRPAAR